MARNKPKAWLTCVTNDDSVISALVLAESLRRTRTTKRISVIASGNNLSSENKRVLRSAFDDVFWLDTSGIRNKEELEYSAKAYAFSLEIFGKCVFLEGNTVVMENCDGLFDGKEFFKNLLLASKEKRSCLDLFLFTPSKSLFHHFDHNSNKNGVSSSSDSAVILNGIQDWMKNNSLNGFKSSAEDNLNNKRGKAGNVSELCLKKGRILMTSENLDKPGIVHFTGLSENGKGEKFTQIMKNLLKNPTLGIMEKIIVENWLNIYENSVSKILLAPLTYANKLLNSGTTNYENEPIAIIGMSCRFPGANNLDEFWNLLYSAQEGIGTPPPFRWKREHSVFGISGKERQTNAGFLPCSVDEFDAKFFGVSPKEALFLDPQARLLHEVLWESLESAGINPQSLYGSHTGIFTGSWMNDYRDIVQRSAELDFFRTYMGNSMGATAARLSFMLGLTGPSIATESGCSSAIVAVDLAVKSLRSGETNLALVGGVNLLLHPFESNIIDYVISPDGRCKTFDEGADGFGRAEGCGVLVLKKLSDAMRDRDNIWAMIRGSAISQEGMSRSLGTPTVDCEALAMELALRDAGVEPEMISFVETHGTGTSVGDPMEVKAICKAYGGGRRKEPLIIGSVKTNVGHTESCSGITGIIKTVLAMQNEWIPKHLNLKTLNPLINLEEIPAVVPMENVRWPRINGGKRRMAGVSSFGITGTDGHVILEEGPDGNMELPWWEWGMERPLHILKISGKSRESLEESLKLYQVAFQTGSDQGSFADLAYTGNTGRAVFKHRAFLIAGNKEEAGKLLETDRILRGDAMETSNGTEKKICFLFSGQGSQYTGMGKLLYDTSPVFRVYFERCEWILKENYGLSIGPVIWDEKDSKEINRTIYSQIAIFCLEYCLLKLWESWGVKPDVVLGHSLGEYCAAVAADILTFEDALKLVAERSLLIDALPEGRMLVVKGGKPEVEQILNELKIDVDIAAENSEDQTVVAGDTEEIQKLKEILSGMGYKAVVLDATHAFHSRHMDTILERFKIIADGVQNRKGSQCQYISGVEGRLLDNPASEMDAEYWVKHTREKVSFMGACEALRKMEIGNFVEIGGHPILSTFVMQNIGDLQGITCYPSLRRNKNDWEIMLDSLGRLFLKDFGVNWDGFDEPYNRKKISGLPGHPFNRKGFWVESNQNWMPMVHPLVGHFVENASGNLSIFENRVSISGVSYLRDHCIGDMVVFPGAGFCEMGMVGGYCVANGLVEGMERGKGVGGAMQLENLRILQPLDMKDGKGCRFQTIVKLVEDREKEQSGYEVKIYHQNEKVEQEGIRERDWVLHATALFHPCVGGGGGGGQNGYLKDWGKVKLERMRNLMDGCEGADTDDFYKAVDGAGLKFGEKFRTLRKQWRQEVDNGMDEIVVEMEMPGDSEKYILHPVVIDGMIQSGLLAGFKGKEIGGGAGGSTLRVPIGIGRLTVFGNEKENKEGPMYLHTEWEDGLNCKVMLVDKDFTLVALLEGLEVIETNVKTIQSVLEIQKRELPDSWEEIWKPIQGPGDNLVELMGLESIFREEEFQNRISGNGGDVKEDDKQNMRKMNRLVQLYALKSLREVGWKPEVGEKWSVGEFCEKWNILGYFGQQVHFYFVMFGEEMMEFDEKEGVWLVKGAGPEVEDIEKEADELFEELVEIENLKIIAKIYKNIEGQLGKILRGEESVLTMLYPQGTEGQEYSAEMYYQNYPGRKKVEWTGLQISETILRKLYERNLKSTEGPGPVPKRVLRVLEVGAGTGSMTGAILPQIGEIWGGKFEYYYTDISGSFFAKAEKRLDEWRGNLKFGIFNIEESPLGQGIPLNYFDMVLASDVLHATRNLEECVRNLRQCLRAGGMMHFTESLTMDWGITFVFGLFEGYWRFEDFEERPYHCCVDGGKWREILKRCGFNFVNVQQVYMGIMGCVTAEATDCPGTEITKLKRREIENEKKWLIFYPDGGNEVIDKVIEVILRCGGGQVEKVMMPESRASDDMITHVTAALKSGDFKTIVFCWGLSKRELDQSRIALPFMLIAQYMLELKKAPKLYVLTRRVHSFCEEIGDVEVFNPSGATLFGMVKSLKNESSDLFVRYVDLDEGMKVEEILYELVVNKEGREKDRVQVGYRDGVRFEPRFNRANLGSRAKDDLELPRNSDRYQLVLPKTRLINDLVFDVLGDDGVIGENEVGVKVKAYALNFRDIFAILKPSEEFEGLNVVGLDFAGVVTKVGGGVEEFRVGDRVFGANFKDVQLPSDQVIEKEFLVGIPEGMSFEEAATLPAVFSTSLYCLVSVGRMREVEWVLIHTGSGGVGLAAIQLARRVGARIVTTAGSTRKRRFLRGMGVEHVFHSRNLEFEKGVMRVTEGKGVDIVLNSLTGPGFKEASLRCLGKGGRFVEMSKLGVWGVEEVKGMRDDVEYSVVDLTKLGKEVWKELLRGMKEYLGKGWVRHVPYVKFDGLRVRQALGYLQRAKHIGKVVVTMPEVRVREGVRRVEVGLFNEESTYVITGGLGGIGFEVCKWMLGKGAREIVLIGRSGPKPEVAKEIERLNGEGYNIRFMEGDVGDEDRCRDIFRKIVEDGKPIRGIHHCAGVLRDGLYGSLGWEDFEAVYRPKVEGTWNLHRVGMEMGLNLEQFVLYSSITALAGTPAQANHSSANCFEDAFAHYRYSLGLPATSINWGQWSQVGCAKEVNVTGVLPVSVKRMLNGLEEVLRGNVRQVGFGDFESLKMWSVVVPLFKNYLDERLIKSLENGEGRSGHGVGGVLKSEKFWEEMDGAKGKEEKMGVVAVYMKIILREGLRMERDEQISDDANMKDLGVDSLMLIELKNSIQGLLGSRLTVSANMLKDCNTIRELSKCIVDKLYEEDDNKEDKVVKELSKDELIELLQKDCYLDENIKPDEPIELPVDLGQIKTILVTGSTGQLGPYILKGLSKNYGERVSKIICLIRTKDGEKPEGKLRGVIAGMNLEGEVDWGKVRCVRGDVTQDRFSMEENEYNRLCEEVDGVIHLVAKSNHIEPYIEKTGSGGGGEGDDVRSVNVGGTKNLIRFCTEKKTKCIYYASSILAVFGGNKEDGRLCDNWPENGEIERLTENRITGYPISKWVGEVLLRQCSERGVPCKIFRFPWIMGDSRTGQLNYLRNHYILRFLSYLKVGRMPMAPLPAIILPVDLCAEMSLELFWDGDAPWEIYNICHPRPELEVEFVGVAKEEFGRELEVVEFEGDGEGNGFLESLYGEGMPLEGLKEIYEDIDRIVGVTTSDAFQAVQGYLIEPEEFFRNEKVERWVKGYRERCGRTMDILRRDLSYVKDKGFFSRFGL